MSEKEESLFEASLEVGHDENDRLDVFIAEKIPHGLSRSRIQDLIASEDVLVNGKASKPSYRVRQGDKIQVTVPKPEPWDVLPQAIPLSIVYEDEELLVVNKARGMVVHPAAGHREGTLVNAVLAHCPHLKGIGGQERPGIVHRLDKDTTGLIVVAKTEIAMRRLQEDIRERRVKRQYIALVKGFVRGPRGIIDAPLGRNPYDRKKMAIVASGKPAVTDYEVLTNFGMEYTLVLANLRTGRTHQIRVHMAHLRHPVVGDPVYARSKDALGLSGQALHAVKLGFNKPSTGEYLEFTASIPDDFGKVLDQLMTEYREDIPQWLMRLM
jgi:23S rRNA pseudouridine1911/1915/1917 synthase